MGYMQRMKREQGPQRNGAGLPPRAPRQGLPPAYPGLSFDSVSNWEKRFCSQMPWRDFCDKKKVTHIFPKVLNWDDSAGKEAFDNAKARYWAEINNLSCDIPIPDPDKYIDTIDLHTCIINPLLLEDLYKKLPPSCQETPDLDSIPITPTGWDVVDPSPADNIPEFIFADNIVYNPAESITIIPTGWGDEELSDHQTSIEPLLLDSIPITGTSLDAVDQSPADYIPESDNVVYDSATYIPINFSIESIRIIPTGWGDEEGSESINGRDLQGRRSNCGFDSNYVNQRCHEKGYQMDDRWTKYAVEQYFWHHNSSLDRGLSCSPQNH